MIDPKKWRELKAIHKGDDAALNEACAQVLVERVNFQKYLKKLLQSVKEIPRPSEVMYNIRKWYKATRVLSMTGDKGLPVECDCLAGSLKHQCSHTLAMEYRMGTFVFDDRWGEQSLTVAAIGRPPNRREGEPLFSSTTRMADPTAYGSPPAPKRSPKKKKPDSRTAAPPMKKKKRNII